MNSFRGPGRFSTDMSLTKIFRLSSTNNQRFELRLEAFNVFDQLLLGMPNADRNTATFGSIYDGFCAACGAVGRAVRLLG